MTDEYTELIGAILFQAARDYVFYKHYEKEHRKEFQELSHRYPSRSGIPQSIQHKLRRYHEAVNIVAECERFFRSDWFKLLAPGYDGEEIIRRLKRKPYKKLKQQLRFRG